ncbi:MAG TPA: AAA family ATPase, partial [Spirochaetota bacterium]|nr:AAA family ATPase [Spirochaetota bacterium]
MSKLFKTTILIFVIILSALSIAGIAFFRSDVFSNSFSAVLPFEYPLFSASDGNGCVYIIDSSQRRILKTSLDGKVLLLIEGGKRKKNSFYNASEICPLSDGSFYIINVIPDSGGFFTEAEEIQKYSSYGEYQHTVFRREYSSGEKKSYLVQRGSLQKLSGESSGIRWYEIDEETISNLTKGEWFKIEDIIIDSYKGRIAEKHLHIIEVLKQKLKEDKIKVLAKDKLIKILKQDFSKEEIAEIIKLIPEGAKIKFDDEKLKPIKSKDAKRFSKEELTEKLKKSYSEEEEIQAIQNAALKRNLDPVIGRKNETMSLIQVLCRRGKSNPVIIGEPGVGKTALVMALAQRIADKRVPEHLQDKKLIELGMSSLVAGTKHRGEFEERFDQLLKELQQDSNLLVFIDELHLIIGAGDSKGGMDAANILKPALARGDISL